MVEPQLALTKDAVDRPERTVRAGERVTYQVDVANTAPQLRPSTPLGESRLGDTDTVEESPNTSRGTSPDSASGSSRGSARDDAAGLALFGEDRTSRTDPNAASATGQRLSTGMRVNRASADQPGDALDVVVVDTLPEGLGCRSLASRPTVTLRPVVGGTDELTAATLRSDCDDATGTLTSVVDRVPAGSVASLGYELVVADDAPAGAEYTNRATIRSYGDPSGL